MPLGLGIGAFVLYVITAAPGLYWLDSGELTAASFQLGVAHPPGFPLHSLAGKLVCLLPLGSVAFRLVLLSAACAALTVGFATALGARLARSKGVEADRGVALVAGATAGLVIALGHIFWRQATVAEVYSLSAACVLGSLWLLFDIRETEDKTGGRDPRLVLFLALVAGLATFGAHPTYRLLVLPTLLGAWILGLRHGGRHLRAVPAVFGLGSLVVLYLVAAGGTGRSPDWANATTFGALWEHVTAGRIRESFGALMLSGRGEVVWPHLTLAWEVILSPFVGLALPLAAVGAWRLLVAGGAARLLGGALLFCGVGDFVYSFWLNPMGLEDLQNGMTLVTCLGILAGVGLAVVATWIGHQSQRLVPAVALALSLITTLPPLLDALPEKWSGAGHGASDWVDAALEEAPPRAVIFTESDDLSAGLLYAQMVEGARPDALTLVRQHLWVAHDLAARLRRDDDPRLPWRELGEYLSRGRQARIQDQGNLLTLLVEGALRHRAVLWEPGDGTDRSALRRPLWPGVPLFHVAQATGAPGTIGASGLAPAQGESATTSGKETPHTAQALLGWPEAARLVERLQRVLRGDEGDLAARVRARHLNALGLEFLSHRQDPGGLDVARRLFGLALQAWPLSVSARVNGAVILARQADLHERAGRNAEAERLLVQATEVTEKALALAPNNYSALVNAGRFRLRLAELSRPPDGPSARWEEIRARGHFLRAIRLFPDRAEPHFNLGVLAARQSRFGEARRHFKATLTRDPRHQAARLYLERVERSLADRVVR